MHTLKSPAIRFERLTSLHFKGVAFFCANLRKDEHPSTLWWIDENNALDLVTEPNHGIVALEGNSILGLGIFKRGGWLQNHLAELSIAVSSESRRRGVASQLLNELEILAGCSGIRLLKALILENNLPSRQFFTRHGYRQTATLHDEFELPGVGMVNDCVYYRQLDPQK